MSQRYFGHRLGPVGGAVVAVLSLMGGAAWFVRRLERRQGRRYHRTVGEPEKVVWLAAPGLD